MLETPLVRHLKQMKKPNNKNTAPTTVFISKLVSAHCIRAFLPVNLVFRVCQRAQYATVTTAPTFVKLSL